MAKHKFDANQIANITWKTLDDLWAIGNPDCICLYTRYCYIVNLRGNTEIHADNQFMKNGTGISRDRLSKAKAKLLKYGFIENINKGRGGWWIKVNHLVTLNKMKIAFNSYGMPVSVSEINAIRNPVIRDSATIYKDNNINTYKDIKEEEKTFFPSIKKTIAIPNTTPPILTPSVPHTQCEPPARASTLPATAETVKGILVAWERLTGKKEVISKKIENNIIAMIKKYGFEEVERAIGNTEQYHDSYKAGRQLKGIFNTEDTFLGALNFKRKEI